MSGQGGEEDAASASRSTLSKQSGNEWPGPAGEGDGDGCVRAAKVDDRVAGPGHSFLCSSTLLPAP